MRCRVEIGRYPILRYIRTFGPRKPSMFLRGERTTIALDPLSASQYDDDALAVGVNLKSSKQILLNTEKS